MKEVDVYFFLGWLAGKRMIGFGWDEEKQLYTVPPTSQTIVEVASEFMRDIGMDQESEDRE